MADTEHYYQGQFWKDICSGCGAYEEIWERRRRSDDKVIRSLCWMCETEAVVHDARLHVLGEIVKMREGRA